MGLYAVYQSISDENLINLKEIENSDDMIESVEKLEDKAEIYENIDKMWDVIHFVLTGVDSSSPIKNDPLSEAIVGGEAFDKISEFIAFTEKERVKDILVALDDFNIEEALDNFSMEKCKNAKLYPDIWDYEEEIDEIKEEILHYFESLKSFYRNVLRENSNVLVSIY